MQTCLAEEMRVKAAEWYQRLAFPQTMDAAFKALVKQAPLEEIDAAHPLEYLLKQKNYGLNLVFFLAGCDEMYRAYCERGLSQAMFDAMARTLVDEAQICLQDFGAIGVYETAWFYEVINRQSILRIGRLEFEMHTLEPRLACDGLQPGESVLSVHIPGREAFSVESCCQSMKAAEEFFMRFYPEFDFSCFICDSWMLDETVDAYLGAESNIRRFRELFHIYHTEEADDALKFVMGRTVTRENIASFSPKTGLQVKLQRHVSEGGKLYRCCGRRACSVKRFIK